VQPRQPILPYIFDLELSGRCNTVCTFCPRDEMKRGEQFMSEENFEHFFHKFRDYVEALNGREAMLPHERVRLRLARGEQSPVRVLLCGMGESLMHPGCPEWIGRIRSEIGVRVSVVTNGILLKETLVEKLAEARITVIVVSVPGIDRETYTRYVPLDWDRVMRNIERAHARLPGRININVPIPDDATFTPEQAQAFWQAKGIPIGGIYHCHNRGGFLDNPELTGRFGQAGGYFCGIIARHNFIAWDGRVLSCCHDLHAENVLGHVATDDFVEIALRKTPIVEQGPRYRICGSCNDCERLQPMQIICSLEAFPEAPVTAGPSYELPVIA
jgi:pyruvate-formate lyase-activating enzyme